MSTRSTIGILNLSGQVKSIYCHSDGYPEGPHGVGYVLVAHYNSFDAATALIAMGNCSFLGKTLGHKHLLFSPPADYEGSGFYHRDRDDPWKDNKPARSATLWRCVKNEMQAYLYVWVTSEACWKMLNEDETDLELIPGAPYLQARARTRPPVRLVRAIQLDGS